MLMKINDAKKMLVHLIKEELILYKYYSRNKSNSLQVFVSVIDDRRNSFGLTDRLKGIISLYAFSKIKNIPFKCKFNHPFDLALFLKPNQYNWQPTEKELSTNSKNVRILILHGEDGKRLINLKTTKQLHGYINRDYLPLFNKIYDAGFEWGILFNELFRPTPVLEEQLNFHLSKLGTNYKACVFRFQSLLGDFNEYDFPSLDIEKQQTLIDKCINELLKIKNASLAPLLVTSDSSLFLEKVSNIEGIYSIPGKVVHMDCDTDEKTEVYLKSFVDFFMLSKAQKIYSIGTSEMYPTEFPLYAAKINNVAFERILI